MLRNLCALRRRDARFPARTSSSQLDALLRFGHRQLPRHLAQELSGHDVNGVYNAPTSTLVCTVSTITAGLPSKRSNNSRSAASLVNSLELFVNSTTLSMNSGNRCR